MVALEERKYFQSFDRSFRITLLLDKLPLLNLILIRVLNTVSIVIRTIYSRNKQTGIITIINLHRLGDTVFTIPAIKKIYQHYYNYKIFICCYPETKPILALAFKENDLILIDKNDFYLNRRLAKHKVRKKIKLLGGEIIFDLTGMPASSSMLYNSSAHTIIGMNYPHLKGLYNKFINLRVNPDFMDIYLDVVNLVIPMKENRKNIKEFPVNIDINSKILIHPFAIRKAKEWNLSRFIQLANHLLSEYEVKIICPPGFVPNDVKHEIQSRDIPFTETAGVQDLIEEIRECSLFISNDSGPTYIASLLGKATFTIYGPTNPRYSHPSGSFHRYKINQLKCSAKDYKFCFTLAGVHCPSNECLQSIKLDDVTREIIDFINFLGLKKKEHHQTRSLGQ